MFLLIWIIIGAMRIYVEDNLAAQKLGLEIYKLGSSANFRGIDLLCIGTDRATGDSLGPLVGNFLSKGLHPNKHLVRLFGTLKQPVHANNICDIINIIDKTDRLLIAVDASLGNMNNVGFINIGLGNVYPGASLSKDLPAVGDIFITGVVNSRSPFAGMEGATLLSTRLSVVMGMARIIARGLLFGVNMLCYEEEIMIL